MMKLSAPVYVLKGRARKLSRERAMPLHAALDQIANQEGFSSWSLLAAKMSSESSASTTTTDLFGSLTAGELVLLAARPRQGKTRESLRLAIHAMKVGRQAVFFSLEYNDADVDELFAALGEDRAAFGDRFVFDDSDAISAAHITERLAAAAPGTLVIVDYLQLLDQRRTNPALAAQVGELKSFAARSGVVIVFVCQVDRAFERADRAVPGLDDIRLPNPVDLTLFDRACFIDSGVMEIQEIAAGG